MDAELELDVDEGTVVKNCVCTVSRSSPETVFVE